MDVNIVRKIKWITTKCIKDVFLLKKKKSCEDTVYKFGIVQRLQLWDPSGKWNNWVKHVLLLRKVRECST